MAGKSSIEWCTDTWNPIVGCSVVSPGCTHCYAMSQAARIERMNFGRHVKHAPEIADIPPTVYAGTTQETKGGSVWTGKVALASEETQNAPLRWKRPRRIFVNSMGDLFHESVPDEWIDRVFAVMALSPQHTFQVLTKRSERMREYFSHAEIERRVARASVRIKPLSGRAGRHDIEIQVDATEGLSKWPLTNVWLGISAEDQRRADERVPDLLATPAAVRFVSAEPLLGPINFRDIPWPPDRAKFPETDDISDGRSALRLIDGSKLDWIIVGGESGPGARPCWTPYVRSVVKQCAAAGTAVFVKQLGADVRDRNDAGFEGCEPSEWPDMDPDRVEHDLDGFRDDYQGAPVRVRLKDRKGGDAAEWPEDLRVRQFPGVRT